jgi:SAM-dependent methyltransferase
MITNPLIEFFDNSAGCRDQWIKKNSYYNNSIVEFMRFHVPPHRSILEVGCGTGFLLNALSPAQGVGIDFSKEMVRIAAERYPHLQFLRADALDCPLDETFDYIIMVDTIGYFKDIQGVLRNLRKNCTPRTRIIITSYNYLWEPMLKLGEMLGLKMKQPFSNWLSPPDIKELLHLEDYETIKLGEKLLLPMYLPLFSAFVNRYLAHLPLFRSLCLVQYLIARPIHLPEPQRTHTVSIIVPARNEAGNIDEIVRTLPEMGTHTEIVFVEGGSTDGTWEIILRATTENPHRTIRLARQDGKGKGDAVRKGFAMANGDILMIYDADMTVPADDLTKFYEAITAQKGELLLGSRLVYPMQKQAMRALNLLGNKIFSLIFSWLLNQRIKDTLCGTKVISRADYATLQAQRSYFGDFDPFGDFDLIFGASKMDLRIAEIPIRYQERTYGETNIRRFYHGWLLLKMCCFAMRKIKFL